MIKFSEKNQRFYDLDLPYPSLPDDLVFIDNDQHMDLLSKINSGYHVFSDLSLSEKKPSNWHKWIDGGWLDTSTDDEKYQALIKSLRPITPRQLRLILVKNGFSIADVQAKINAIEDNQAREIIQIEWEYAQNYERLSESVAVISDLIGLDQTQLNELWTQAMQI